MKDGSYQFQKPKFERLLALWQMDDFCELTQCYPNTWFLRVGWRKPGEKVPPPYKVEESTSKDYVQLFRFQ